MDQPSSMSAEDAAASRAAEQARLRKERREAKIKAGGASRLNKITGLGGGIQRDPPPAPPSSESTPAATSTTNTGTQPPTQQFPAHADPDEVDISEHFYNPQTTQRIPTQPPLGMDDAQLRQMMLGFDRPTPPPGAAGLGMPDAESVDDPMVRMMMQMLGGGGEGGPGGPNGPLGGGSPFGGASPFGMPPMGPGQQQQAVILDRYSALWRLLHTTVALALGLYIAVWTGFTGSKAERQRGAAGVRDADADADAVAGFQAKHFFWAFATAEAVLLTTRFFVDRARAPPSGVLWMVVGFLPPPLKGYLEMALRYGQIFSTVKADVLVCIFVLGVASWLRT